VLSIFVCPKSCWTAQVASSLVDHQFGYQDIAVYDESMGQWTKDESLAIETG
jgi:3-mercaptopyruvate sulfurtransferase SseA